MLKLEKTAHLGITLRLREKDSFFKPELLKALTCALILHVGVLLLFQITPFQSSSTFTFPPIQVQTEQPYFDISTLKISQMNEYDDLLPPPPLFFHPLEQEEHLDFPLLSSLIPPFTPDFKILESLETSFWPFWTLPLSKQLEEPVLQMAVSGDLAEYPFESTHPLLSAQRPLSDHSFPPIYINYEVRVLGKTGKVFWYEQTSFDTNLEEILKSLQFEVKNSMDIIEGTIHFAFFPE